MASRREFIKKIGAVTAATTALPLLKYGPLSALAQSAGSSSDYKALVCLFLFGGNDGANMVVPMASSGAVSYAAYQRARRSISLEQESLLPIQGSAGAAYGLHPSLVNVRRLYEEKRAAIMLNVGTLVQPTNKSQYDSNQVPLPRNLYSHSDQVQTWQTANPLAAGGTGWGGRVVDAVVGEANRVVSPSVSVNGSALLLNGQQTRALTISPGSRFGLDAFGSEASNVAREKAIANLLQLDSGVTLIGAANGVMRNAVKGAQEVSRALDGLPELRTEFPENGLGRQLQQVAKVMQARTALGMDRQFFFCGMGGFDNHSDLLSDHAELLSTVDGAVGAFQLALEELGVANQVVTFTESEFGRTLGPSASAGSDHAWGSHQFVIGGPVKGGDTYGLHPTYELQGPDDAGDRGLWIPTTSLDQYANSMARWFGLKDTDILSVFPNLRNFRQTSVGLI
jgi:uncharacterized protein (DUF1501 family)